jgi:cytochrome b561
MVAAYTRTQIRLHWIVFALIALQYLLHEPIARAWDMLQSGVTPGFSPLIAAHVLGGLLVLLFVPWRIALRRIHGVPPPPAEEPPLLQRLAKATHAALYLLMVLMPLSGAAAWFGGIAPAAEAHEAMRLILLALIALHAAGAVYHRFVLKSDVMARMLPPRG